jgi:hypothetical protein
MAQETVREKMMMQERSKENGSGYLQPLFFAAALLALMLGLLGVPRNVQAWPSKYTSCSSCHTATEPTATISAALNAVAGNSVAVAPGTTFEIDWIVGNISGSGVLGLEIALPTGWTLASGTANSPALAGWNAVWDAASGTGWQTTNGYSTATQFAASPQGYTINFDTTGWDTGNRNAAYDDASAGDLDGTASTMGTDARVSVPVGTAGGIYTLQVTGVGHIVGGTKGYVTQAITVTVIAAGDATPPVEAPATLAVAPEFGSFVPGSFTISEQFTDAESAVTSCEYTLDGGGAWSAAAVSGSGPYTCTAAGVVGANAVPLTIRMRATSTGGTSTPVQTLNRTVDSAAPTTATNAPAGWQSADVTVALSPNDGSGSGAAGTLYCVDTANICAPAVSGLSVNVTQSAGTAGTQYVRYTSTDNLGNAETIKSAAVQIDRAAPVDGTLTLSPGNGQLGLSWPAATDAGAGLSSPAYTVVRADGTITPPADCSGAAVYTGDVASHTDLGLTNGLDYAYRVCATDGAGNVSVGATATAQPAAVCTYAPPTLTIATGNQQITALATPVSYNISIVNNDSAACGSSSFDLGAVDGNGVDFNASTFGIDPIVVAPGATGNTTLSVSATGGAANGATNTTSFTIVNDGNHGTPGSSAVTTLINLPRSPAVHYNSGETVHFEFRSNTRFASLGSAALSVGDSAGGSVLNAVTLLEVQQGGQWVYTYDWDTTGQPADTYRVEIWDSNDAVPLAESMIVIGNPAVRINLFADAGYTTATDIFAQGATVYVEVRLSSPETGIANTEITDWYGNFLATGSTITQTGTTLRYNFVADFVGAAIPDGDWGYLFWRGTDTGVDLHRPLQRNDAGCGSCTYADPTVNIVTGNQTINVDGGSVAYVVNVTNNDSVACGSTLFDLVAVDDNLVNFNASTFASDPLAVNPGVTAATTLTVSAKAGQSNGSIDNTSFYTAADGNHLQSLNSNSVATDLNVVDLVAPTVSAFVIPATSTTQTVPVTTFTASDNVAVSGYLITESAVTPAAGAAGWVFPAPATYTVAADGSYTLYAWAKDAQGNVSASLSAPVTVDSVAPVVTAFTIPTPQAAWTVTVTTFTASDNIGVTGYKVTESAIAPGAGDVGWLGAPAASYTFSVDGSYTLYAWAKDAIGNVSLGVSAPVTVDTSAPSVQTTVPANGATAVPLDGSVTINWNEPVDCGTVSAVSITSASPGWTFSSCSGNQAIFITAGQTYLTPYNVTVTTTVTDLTGNPMAGNYAFSYTTAAQACAYNPPTVAITTASQDAVVDDDLVSYDISVTNNDSGSCGSTTFPLVLSDSNGIDFNASSFGTPSLTLAPSAVGNTTIIVSPKSGSLNGAADNTYFYTDGSADPNHGNSVNSNTVTTTINVPCDLAPTVSIDTANKAIVLEPGSAAYTVSVTNSNALACGSTPFDLVAADSNATSFEPTVFTLDPLTVAPGGSNVQTTMTVTSKAGQPNGSFNNSYFYTAVNGTIPASASSNSVTTTISRPCSRVAPTFNVAVNKNIAPTGSAVYGLTVINNDIDCSETTFNLSLLSETGVVASFTLPSILSAPTVTVPAGGSDSSVSLTVTGNGTGTDGDSLTSTVELRDDANHAAMQQSVAPLTTLKNFNPLIHSSLATGSTKHAAEGGWGVAGGKYGEFTCGTCHAKNTGNIKRVVNLRTAAPDTSKGDFPGSGAAVSFLSAAAGTSDFGNDAGGHAASNRICEVCHSATKYHNYDTANNSGGLTHNNGGDCVSCHKHSEAFKGGGACDSCHGYPPTSTDGKGYQAVEGKGAHLKHVNHIAALAAVTLDPNVDGFGDPNTTAVCGVCHDLSTAANHETSGGSRSVALPVGYQFGPGAPSYNGVQGLTSGAPDNTPKTCSNIACHFQSSPWWE